MDPAAGRLSAASTRRAALVPTLGLTLALALAAPAPADWLVMEDGTRVETRGGWEIKGGRLVVFTRADGKLSSIRASEVDLDASRRVTAAAEAARNAPPEAPEKPAREAVVALTDADFTQLSPEQVRQARPPAADQNGEAADQAPASGPASAPSRLSISSWQDTTRPESTGVEIFGLVTNPHPNIASQVIIQTRLVDENGDTISTQRARLSSPSIRPQGRENFRVIFPGIFDYEEVEFEVSSRPLRIDPAPADIPPSPAQDDANEPS